MPKEKDFLVKNSALKKLLVLLLGEHLLLIKNRSPVFQIQVFITHC